MIKDRLLLMLKGVAMGAANVVPGVSGGTIALITGVFERIINSIKSVDLDALKLLFRGKFKEFANHVDFFFLLFLFSGVGIGILGFARVLKFFFEYYPIPVWAFFLGLVGASVWFVAKKIEKWNLSAIIPLIVGTAIALSINLLTPASENSHILYLMLCGSIGVSSMILPGLSGSFVLILMGNYNLVMIEATSNLELSILLPVFLGAVIGIILFSRFLSWVLGKYPNSTLSTLAGFILGSLIILWPWKNEVTEMFGLKEKVVGYQWFFPEINAEFYWSIFYFILGFIIIFAVEYLGNLKLKKEQ